MNYKITNTGRVPKSYVNDQGQRISFEPGQTKRLSEASLPPRENGWRIEEIGEKETETTKGEE